MPKVTKMKQTDKAVFAAYLNLARHNIYLIINHLQQQLGLQPITSVEQIPNASLWGNLFKPSKKNIPEDNRRVVKLLSRHFPFFNENQDPATLKSFFEAVLTRLNEERNHHTHYYHKKSGRMPVEATPALAGHISSLADIVQQGKYFLEDKIKKGFDRQESAKKRGETLPQLYRGFGANELITLKSLKLDLFDRSGQNFTTPGLAFFTCLFLSKTQAALFLAKIEDFKKHPNKSLLTEWIWSYPCRLPQPKLESGDISMDILNELHRAPIPLYNFISEENKRRFEVDFHHNNPIIMEALGNQKSILKRKKDRFPYLAMRVMDDTKHFDQLRFHVHLGKWLRKEYISSTIEERKIYENLRSFGRLGNFIEENAPKDWKASISSTNEKGENNNWHLTAIEQFAPHYLITGNRIGIKINRTNKTPEWYPLSAYRPTTKKNKKGRKQKVERFQPDAILSTYELGNLYFYQRLYHEGKLKSSAEEFIKNYIQTFYQFCDAVRDGIEKPVETDDFVKKIRRPFEPITRKNNYSEKELRRLEDRKTVLQMLLDEKYPGLLVKDLPDHLREFMLGYDASDVKAIELKLNQRKRTTQRQLKELNKTIEKILARERTIPTELTNEALAKTIVKDIILWRPKDVTKQDLALEDAEQLIQILTHFPHNKLGLEEHIMSDRRGKKFPKSMRLIDKEYDFAHPFLHKVNPLVRKDLREIYKFYLEEKSKWLTQLVQTEGTNESKPTQYFRLQLANEKGQNLLSKTLLETNKELEKVLNYFKKQEAEIGGSKILKNGDLATYLAEDIIFLKPKNTQEGIKNFGKPNNQEYKRLQSMLALYSADKVGLVAFMTDLGLIGNPEENLYVHPFLHLTTPSECSGVKDFYEQYIKTKLLWLDGILKEVKEAKVDRYQKYFKGVISNAKIKTYSNLTVLLPRGIFNDLILDALLKEKNNNLQEDDNFVCCLREYVEKDTQPFYQWHRTYNAEGLEKIIWKENPDEWETSFISIKNVIERLSAKKTKLQQKRKDLKEDEGLELNKLKRLKRKAMGNEQQIRYFQHTDRVLFLMLKDLTKDKNPGDAFFIDNSKIKLATIYPEHRNQKALEIAKNGSTDIVNQLDEPILMEMQKDGKSIIDVLSIKRYGLFRHFFKDRRLGNLLKYFSESYSQKETFSQLLIYFENLEQSTQVAILNFLKLQGSSDDILLIAEQEDLGKEWIYFDNNWRSILNEYFDKDIFQIKQLKQLVDKMDQHSIHRRQLERELKTYEIQRESLFAKILDFEEMVYKKCISDFKKKLQEKSLDKQHYLDHWQLLEIVQSTLSKELLSDELLNELREFRNAVSHNEIYYSDYLKSKIGLKEEKIVAPLMNYIEGKYKDLTVALEDLPVN